MLIRPALPSEADALTALTLAAKAAWGYDAAQMRAWRESLTVTARQLEEQPACVAEQDGALLGFYTLRLSEGSCELDNLRVAPDRMRRGIGTALLAHAMGTARQLGVDAIHIDADPHAERFYLRCGAVRCGENPAPIAGEPKRFRPQLLLSADAAVARSRTRTAELAA